MRLKLFLIFFLIASPAWPQARVVPIADMEKSATFTTSASGSCWEVDPNGIGYHAIRWIEDGSISTGTVKLVGSNTASTCASPVDIIAAAAITSSGEVTATAGQYKYVQLVTEDQTGTGTLRVFYFGTKTSGASVTATLSATDNAVLDDIADGIPADTELPAAAALADATANPTVPAVAAYLMAFNGTTWDRVTKTTDPCDGGTKTFFPVDIVTATTVEIANAVADQFFYICSVNLVTAAANNVAIAHDNSDSCGSITAGMNGGVTAAEGWNFGANGGISLGNGSGTVMKTATANHYLCILTSANTQLSGTISYVSAP